MFEQNFYVDINLNKQQLVNAGFQLSEEAPTSPVQGQFYFNTTTNNFEGYNGTEWINLSQIISNPVTIRGEITNANTNPAYPTSPEVGDSYFVTTNAGTVGASNVEVGDQLVYGSSGWFVVQANLQAATTALAGYVRLATQAEANAGSLNSVAVTPQALAGYLSNYLYNRKSVTLISSLAANTPTTVSHGLGLASPEEFIAQCWLGSKPIGLGINATSVNALSVESNVALSNVKVVVNG